MKEGAKREGYLKLIPNPKRDERERESTSLLTEICSKVEMSE